MEEKTAESIFEMLTARNPDVEYPTPSSQTVSSRPGWFRPKQLKLWCEFSFQTLDAIYGGSLMHEARQKGCRLPSYPYLKSDVDCVVDDEPTTLHLLTKWNHTIVTASLDLVEKFRPCSWVPKARKTKTEGRGPTDTDKETKQPPRLRSKSIGDGKRKFSTRLVPDAGGSSSSRANGSPDALPPVEQLPKEYKTASKWQSSNIFKGDFIDEMGEWKQGTRRSNTAKPIEQIYTYCVNLGCRYGCILTTGEAFIFRIKPCTTIPGPANVSSSNGIKELKRRLATDGLMEYVSVPWDNHRSGDPDKYKDLTVNLALWFIHILAGNRHEISWDYGALTSEKPATELNTSFTAPTSSQVAADPGKLAESREEPISWGLRSFSRKRKRNEPHEDVIHYSFSESQQFATQSTDCPTEQSVQSDSSSILEREGETLGESQTSESKKEDLSTHDRSTSAKRHRLGRVNK